VDKPDPQAEWWTTSDVAAYLGVQASTVSNYRKRDQMPAPDTTIGRTHVWRPSRIVEWHGSRPRPGVGGRSTSRHEPVTAVLGARAGWTLLLVGAALAVVLVTSLLLGTLAAYRRGCL
jgi:ABC-type dipeptide/oligopeptide/nickel transport system permease component